MRKWPTFCLWWATASAFLGNVTDGDMAVVVPFLAAAEDFGGSGQRGQQHALWPRARPEPSSSKSEATTTSLSATKSSNMLTLTASPSVGHSGTAAPVQATPIANNQPVDYVMLLNDSRIYNLTDIPPEATTIFVTANICGGPPNLNYSSLSMDYDYTELGVLRAGWNPAGIEYSAQNFEYGFANLTIDISAVNVTHMYVQLDLSQMTFDNNLLSRRDKDSDKDDDDDKDDKNSAQGSDGVFTALPSDVIEGAGPSVAPSAVSTASQPATSAGSSVLGDFTYSLGVSWESPIYSYKDTPNLYLVDTDYNHALFVTGNLTTDPQNATSDHYIVDIENAIYDITAFKFEDEKELFWLSNSYCAITKGPAVLNSGNCDVSYTKRGLGHYYKQQFFMKGLNDSTPYSAVLTKPNAKTAGGTVYEGVMFAAKTSDNCQLVYDLDFCSDVAYAVPGNSSMVDSQGLARLYDENASKWWQNFTYSQQVVACNASLDSRYSILKTCDDCADSYKQWLCAVTIPRCADWSNNSTFLQEREPGTSRNELIDRVLMPGRYKEILPCLDLCQKIVQDCDASLGFQCPRRGRGLDSSYGLRSGDGDITCSYLGAVYFLDGASVAQLSALLLTTCFFFVILW